MRISKTAVIIVLALFSGILPLSSVAHAADEVRRVTVLSDVPQDLTLTSRFGDKLEFSPSWKQTGRGYETLIEVPTSLLHERPALMLVRADRNGFSRWDQSNGAMEYLRNHTSNAHDPVCVGGMRWCAVRGL